MLSFYSAILVQVVLESLPVSSSAHIRLLELFLNKTYSKELMYLLHIPTLVIVSIFLGVTFLSIIKEYKNNPAAFVKLLFFISVIDGITALFFIFFHYYEALFFLPNAWMLLIGLSTTASLLYSLRFVANKHYVDEITGTHALIVGVAQGWALLPGISRFATVYATCSWLGLSPSYAFYITWLVQMPLIAAAVSKTVFSHAFSTQLSLLTHTTSLMVVAAASVIAYYALAQSYEWVVRKRLWIYAYYMIFPILLTLFYINYYT